MKALEGIDGKLFLSEEGLGLSRKSAVTAGICFDG